MEIILREINNEILEKLEEEEIAINANYKQEENVKNLVHHFLNREKDKHEELKQEILAHPFENDENSAIIYVVN